MTSPLTAEWVKPTSLRTTVATSSLRWVPGGMKNSNAFLMIGSWGLLSKRVGMRQGFVWYPLFGSYIRSLGLTYSLFAIL